MDEVEQGWARAKPVEIPVEATKVEAEQVVRTGAETDRGKMAAASKDREGGAECLVVAALETVI